MTNPENKAQSNHSDLPSKDLLSVVDSDDLPPCPFCGEFSVSVEAYAYPDNDNPKRWDAIASCGCCSCSVRTGGYDATDDYMEAPRLAEANALRIWKRRKDPLI